MRIAHSLWTKPLVMNRWFLENQLEPSIWLYALSFAYAKRISDKVVLHTDDLGYDFLNCIPYDKIYLSLNELEDEHQKFWSYGKILALENEPIKSIHIDGDVFLKKSIIIDRLHFKNDEDLICQMIESGYLFDVGYKNQLPYFNNAFRNVKIKGYGIGERAFNGGVLGFGNQKLKDEFIKNYKKMIFHSKKDENIMFNMDGSYEPNIILEQYYLASLCEYRNDKIKFVLDPTEVEKVNSLNAVADKLGFVHAWGKTKYEVKFQELVKQRLKEINPRLYNSVKLKIENSEFTYNI